MSTELSKNYFQSKFVLNLRTYITEPALDSECQRIISEARDIILKLTGVDDVKTKYNFNIIRKGNCDLTGIGFLWIEDERIVNMLLGLKPDGGKNVHFIDDPNYVAPVEETKTIIEKSKWSDIIVDDDDDDDFYNQPIEQSQALLNAKTVEKVVRVEHVIPKIEIKDKPLLKFRSTDVNEEQKRTFIKNNMPIPPSIETTAFRAIASSPEDHPTYGPLCSSILYSRGVNPQQNIESIINLAKRFNTSTSIFKGEINGKYVESSYPIVTTITSGKDNKYTDLLIIYEMGTTDALFAQYFTKKIQLASSSGSLEDFDQTGGYYKFTLMPESFAKKAVPSIFGNFPKPKYHKDKHFNKDGYKQDHSYKSESYKKKQNEPPKVKNVRVQDKNTDGWTTVKTCTVETTPKPKSLKKPQKK